MSIKFIKITIALMLFSALSLNSCGYYHEQQEAYSKANNGPGLVVNPPLTEKKMSDAYVIPQNEKQPASVEAPPPPGSSIDLANSNNKIST